jgi:hypothetical protein
MGEGGSIAMLTKVRLHRVKPVSAGKSAEVAAGASLSFLRYCHSGGDNSSKGLEIPILLRIFLEAGKLRADSTLIAAYARHKIIEIKKVFIE